MGTADFTARRASPGTKPVGYYFDVITNGIRTMPAHGDQIPVEDRWAIAAYIKALQRSQNATINDVPDDKRGALK